MNMQLLRHGDDGEHKELAALSAVLAIETGTLSIFTHQGQILSWCSHAGIYFSQIFVEKKKGLSPQPHRPIAIHRNSWFYQMKSEQK